MNSLFTPYIYTEAISAQDDKHFTEELERRINEIVTYVMEDKSYKDLSTSALLDNLASTIHNRLGLTVDFDINSLFAAVEPFYVHSHNVMLDPFWHGTVLPKDMTDAIKQVKKDKLLGTVDMANARVTGVFSDYRIKVYMNFKSLINEELSVREIAAILMHELGHAFYSCAYADRADRTNRVLAGVAEEILNDNPAKLEFILKNDLEFKQDKAKEIADDLTSGKRIVATGAYYKITRQAVDSIMLYDKYNDTTFEQSADQFSSRFGYGKDLVIALDKISVDLSANLSLLIINQFVNTWLIISIILLVTISFLSGGLFNIIIGVVWTFVVKFFVQFNIGSDTKNLTYDDLKIRYQRVRNDAVDQLKVLKMKPETQRRVINDIHQIDVLIKSTSQYKPFLDRIADLIFSNSRNARKQMDREQLLEVLASNDLFLVSAEIRSAI